MSYLKLAKVLGPIILIGLVALAFHMVWTDRDKWKDVATRSAEKAKEVGQFKQVLPEDAPSAIEKIGTQKLDLLRKLNDTKEALNDQTFRVLELGQQTQRLRSEADRQRALVQQLTVQRDAWIAKAKAASTRTQRLSAEEEVRQCEEAMDALYQAGF